jgi:HK97 gp10 family phage protein
MSKALTMTLDSREFTEALKQIGLATRGGALREALKDGGSVLQDYIQENIVGQDLVDTGNLLNNWSVESDGDEAAIVGTDTPYAAIHEFGGLIAPKDPSGWLRFQTGDGAWHSVKAVHMPARPYARPAIDHHKDDVARAVGDSLRKSIERNVKKK